MDAVGCGSSRDRGIAMRVERRMIAVDVVEDDCR